MRKIRIVNGCINWGGVGVFLERTKYRIRVGRGLAPAARFALNYGTDKLQCERRGRHLDDPKMDE